MSTTTAIREKPILFSGPMVRAILDGKKTQTRRVVQLPKSEGGEWRPVVLGGGSSVFSDGAPAPEMLCLTNEKSGRCIASQYEAGMRLWVRESFCPDWCDHVIYRADGGSAIEAGYSREPKWKPSIHMPRWASRITLELTDVRVAHVRSISENDCIAEGFNSIDEFSRTWDALNSGRGFPWQNDPWVWTLEFRVL